MQQSAHIKLRVYDLLGREVAVLFDGTLPLGRYMVKWRPGTFSSGVYLIRLESEGSVKAQRMVLKIK